MKKLKICHWMKDVAHGPLSWDDIRAGERGMTGSEQSFMYLARAQARLGHQVVCYIPTDDVGVRDGVEMIDYRGAYPRFRKADDTDVAISWLSADALRGVNPKALRVHSLQINDWLTCSYGYDEYVDVYVACSRAHRQWLMEAPFNPGPDSCWEIIPNGVDLKRFQGSEKRQALRFVHASSPDRGLHWLLYLWPEIRFAFPNAELHVYYEFKKWVAGFPDKPNSEPAARAMYITGKLNTWGGQGKHGLYLHGAVSPELLAPELQKSDIMLYCCDPIRPTEGFGVAVMEACAAGVVPVITDADAFPEIYADSGAVIVPRRNRQWVDDFVDAIIRLAKDRDELEDRRRRVVEFAKGYDWDIVAKKWQETLERQLQAKSGVVLDAKKMLPPVPGGTGPVCGLCGLSEWVEIGGGPATDVYHPNIDVYDYPNVDIVHDLSSGVLPIHDAHATRVKAIHILNHLSYTQAKGIFREVYRVLKSGGEFIVMVTDLEYVLTEINKTQPDHNLLSCIYGTEGESGTRVTDFHKWGYTFTSLMKELEQVGYTNIQHAGHYNPWEFHCLARKP